MATREAFAGPEAQAHLQALVVIVSRQEALPCSSPRQTRVHDFFSPMDKNYHQVRQAQPTLATPQTPTRSLSPTTSCNSMASKAQPTEVSQHAMEERKEAQEDTTSNITCEDEPSQATDATPTVQTTPATPSRWQQRVQKELEKSGKTPWQRRTPKRKPPTPTSSATPSPNAKEPRQEHNEQAQTATATTPAQAW